MHLRPRVLLPSESAKHLFLYNDDDRERTSVHKPRAPSFEDRERKHRDCRARRKRRRGPPQFQKGKAKLSHPRGGGIQLAEWPPRKPDIDSISELPLRSRACFRCE